MPAFSITAATVGEHGVPSASLVVSPEFAVMGTVVSLDGRISSDPNGLPLTYIFTFVAVPIGSRIASDGFKTLNEAGSLASFAPDVVGSYRVSLVVSNGVFESPPADATVDVRAIAVPHARGMVPDGKFIWSYLRDVWTQVDGKEFFETLWSALIQISGAELLKLYQVDFNKSIRDIQDHYQRRWLKYEPKLAVGSDCSIFLGNHSAGKGAVTGSTGEDGLAIVTGQNELQVVQGTVRPDMAGRALKIIYSRNSENVGTYEIASTTARQGGFKLTESLPKNPINTAGGISDTIVRDVGIQFDFGSTTWSLGASRRFDQVLSDLFGFPYYISEPAAGLEDVRVGDVAVIRSGVNVGLYRIVSRSGGYIVVDKKPAGASTGVESSAVTIYRPVGFSIPAVEDSLSDTISLPLVEASGLLSMVPGRVLVVNGRTFTVTRVAYDPNQRVPMLSISTDRPSVIPGTRGLPWRVPHTLVSQSQDFEAEGVSVGDVLTVSVTMGSASVDLPCQVVGVDRNRLGFVITNEAVIDGEVPAVPPSFFTTLSKQLGIKTVNTMPDGSVVASDEARDLLTEIGSIFFQRAYWDKELQSPTELKVGKRIFKVFPKSITRNRLLPVDDSVRSIPALQEYISQPRIAKEDGKLFLVSRDQKYEIPRLPIVATERMHYLVDGQKVFSGTVTFRSGSDVLDVEGGDFIDLGIMAGDKVTVEAPITLAGSYEVLQVLSRHKIKLTRPIPAFALSVFVTGRLSISRRASSRFVRFVPGLFTAKSPAPDRLWGEVTFFDNSENIERNFGIMVGLTRQDLDKVTTQASYRQAVAGLMYAYVNGPAVDKVRLGASLLLGLPFTERKGIIRSIDTSYRVDAYGAPSLGRILVEDLDDQSVASGVFRVYTFPVDAASELSGVDINPATGVPYVVGDTVEAFASLSKGVELADFSTDFRGTLTPVQMIQRAHSARIRINDNIFQSSEIGLVSTFLRKITPSYIALIITNTSELLDTVVVEDKLRLNFRGASDSAPSFIDSVGMTVPLAPVLDFRTPKGIYRLRWDTDPYVTLRGGADLVIASDGSITLPGGGFTSPRVNENFEQPLVRPGDVLFVVGGLTEGLYPITAVTDTTVSITGPQLVASTNQRYIVFRPIAALARTGTISAKANSTYTDIINSKSYPITELTVEAGLRSDMVAPGDWLTTSLGTKHIVISTGKTGSQWNKVTVTPQVGGGATAYQIWRSKLFASPTFQVSSGVLPQLAAALLEVGDELQVQPDGVSCAVASVGPVTLSPALPSGSYDVKLLKAGSGNTPILFDQTNRNITDYVKTALI